MTRMPGQPVHCLPRWEMVLARMLYRRHAAQRLRGPGWVLTLHFDFLYGRKVSKSSVLLAEASPAPSEEACIIFWDL